MEDQDELLSPHPLSQLDNNESDADDFATNINIDFNNPANVALFIRQTGSVLRNAKVMELLETVGMNVPDYERDKKRSIVRFFQTIALHPTLKHLSERCLDPELELESLKVEERDKLERLIILCRGVKTVSKYTILNSCLLVFLQDLVKKKYKDVDLMSRYV